MKTITHGERYEERGNPQGWIWLFSGVLWLVNVILRISHYDFSAMLYVSFLCAVLNILNAVLRARYLLIVDEDGIVMNFSGMQRRTIRWGEIVRIVERQEKTWKSGGLYVYTADAPDKAIFVSGEPEVPPIVRHWCRTPIELEV